MRVTIALAALILCATASQAIDATAPRKAGDVYPRMCYGPTADAVIAELPGDVVATIAGTGVKQSDIDAEIAKAPEYLKDQMKEYPLFALEQYVLKTILESEAKEWAKKTGNDKDASSQLLVRNFLSSIASEQTVTSEEVKACYDQNQATFYGASFAEVKDIVQRYLLDEKKAKAREDYIDSAGKRQKIEISSTWLGAVAKKWAENPVEKARSSGKPSFVAFSTVGCCDKMGPVVQQVKSDNNGAVETAFVNIGKEQALAAMYRVRTPPVLIIFDKDGNEKIRENSNLTAEQIQAKLAEVGVK